MNRPSYLLFKKCSKCGEILHVSKFHKIKNGKYGVMKICKECRKIYNNKYREEHKEEISEYGKQWRKNNNEYGKQYYEDNKGKHKQYYEDNKEERLEYSRQYYEEHKEQIKERKKQYYENNKDKILEYNKQWHKNNPEKLFNKHNRRRSKLENQGRGINEEQWKECFQWFDWKCAYSEEKLKDSNDTYGRTIDHIIAIDNGGLNEPWNVVPMRKGYNSSKWNRESSLTWYMEQEYFDIDRLNKIVEWQIYAYEKWGGEEFGELILITDLLEGE